LLKKGIIKNHRFEAQRDAKLDLDCSLLAGLKIKTLAWKQS